MLTQLNYSKIAVFIALEEELEVFRSHFKLTQGDRYTKNKVPIFYSAFEISEGKFVSLDCCCVYDQGSENMRSLVEDYHQDNKPDLVVNIGIAGKIGNDIKLGYVVVAESVIALNYRNSVEDINCGDNYELSFGAKNRNTTKRTRDNYNFLKSNDSITWARILQNTNKWLNNNLSDVELIELKNSGSISTDGNIDICIGNIASGNEVVKSESYKIAIKEKDRNMLAVDMESIGFMGALDNINNVDSLILKGISDPASPKKGEIDKKYKGKMRHYAMRNACLLLQTIVCPNIDLINLALNKKVSNLSPYIGRHLPFIDINSYSFGSVSSYNNLSEFFTSFVNIENLVEFDTNLFERVLNHLTQTDCFQIEIVGAPGTGRTLFLTALYSLAIEKYEIDNRKHYPIFVDLHLYNNFDANLIEPNKDPVHLTDINHLINTLQHEVSVLGTKILLILDGHDVHGKYSKHIMQKIENVIVTHNLVKVVGIGIFNNKEANFQNLHNGYLSNLNLCRIVFSPLIVGDIRMDQFINKYYIAMNCADKKIVVDDLILYVNQSDFSEFDLFTLELISNGISKPFEVKKPAFSDFLNNFCIKFIEVRNVGIKAENILLEAEEIAFKFEILNEENLRNVVTNHVVWALIHSHSQIRNYLVAKFVVRKLCSLENQPLGDFPPCLEYVYPKRINLFFKELTNANEKIQVSILSGVKKILINQKYGFHADALYIAGRLKERKLQTQAVPLLRGYIIDKRDTINQLSGEEKKKALLALRTAYISLAYLGDKDTVQEYLEILMHSHVWEEINRGFHLEYYGDQEYSPNIGLLNIDELNPFPKTLFALTNRLKSKTNPLFQIDLFTLISLAQHRMASGKLPDVIKDIIVKTGRDSLSDKRLTNQDLRLFAETVLENISFSGYHLGNFITELYNLKEYPRAGWVKRNINDPESICDHSHMCCLYALLFLQGNSRYNIDKIVKMLAIHDLAEAKIMDKIKGERSETDLQNEAKYFKMLPILGTYFSTGNLSEVNNLWIEFNNSETYEAKIANDIDEIEPVIQLLRYKNKGNIVLADDLKEWRKTVLNKMRTPEGRLLLKSLEMGIEKESNDPDVYLEQRSLNN